MRPAFAQCKPYADRLPDALHVSATSVMLPVLVSASYSLEYLEAFWKRMTAVQSAMQDLEMLCIEILSRSCQAV